MRILVISDTHGLVYKVKDILLTDKSVTHLLFLGDGLTQMQYLMQDFPEIDFKFVEGNCDRGTTGIYEQTVEIDKIKIFMTHGHSYDVKSGTVALSDTARKAGAQIALYGHTHIPESTYENGLYIINPGSITRGRFFKNSYAKIDITPAGILPNIIEVV